MPVISATAEDSPAGSISTSSQWTRLLCGLIAIFAIFQWSAAALGSDRGQAGLIVGAVVTLATLAVERLWFRRDVASAAQAIGLGAARGTGLAASAGISVLLLLLIPVFAYASGAIVTIEPDAVWLLPGLFAQAGIGEEVLFRGYLFGQLRRGRTFWQAAGVSMLPFVTVHLLLFLTMPWPIALAALLLAVVLSFPLAYLYELGGETIWPPAILHFVVQATVKVILVSGAAGASFPLVWMASSALLPLFVLLIPRSIARVDSDRE